MKRLHMVQGFAEQFGPRELERRVLRNVRLNGRKPSLIEWLTAVIEAKAKGYEVFPNPECVNVTATGRCGGCPEATP